MTASPSPIWFHRDGLPYAGAVTVLDANRATYRTQLKCNRCGGAGGSDAWRFTGWKCYDCGGNGLGRIVDVKLYSAEKLQKLNGTRDKARAKKDAERATAHAEKVAAEQAAFGDWSETDEAKVLAFKLDQAKPDMTDSERDFAGVIGERLAAKRIPTERMVVACVEMLDRVIARAERQRNLDYLGAIGERVTFTGKARCVYERAGNYGMYRIYKFEGPGFVATYKGTKYFPDGEEMTITATVAELESYKGKPQTLIARPKVH